MESLGVQRNGDLRNQEKVLSEAVPGSFAGVKPGEF